MNTMFKLAIVPLVAIGTSCSDDDGDIIFDPVPTSTTFDVVVANVSTVFDFIGSGVFNTPVGGAEPGPVTPGGAYEATFDAPAGGRLSFATMFVQSNDLFYAPSGAGIALFENGTPLTADITDQIQLWDGGTEANQEPGLGLDQAPRQGGADTGPADDDGSVRVYDDAFDNVPDVSDVMRVTVTSEGEGRFTLRIENIANGMDIPTSDGGVAPFVLAPGVWTVGSGSDALFTAGESDRGEGLEALAEDGDPSGLASILGNRTGVTGPLAPGAYAVHSSGVQMFTSGQADDGMGLEALAEDGDPSGLAASLSGRTGVSASGAFDTPTGGAGPGPAFPGEQYTFSFDATAGERLSFATMLVQSNDLFYAPGDAGIELFSSSGVPISGELGVLLWDAGTEVNEAPGIGGNQAPRQSGANTGPTEGGLVAPVDDGFTYPSPVVRVTITPRL